MPQANDIEVVDGIRTYKTPALFDQKMNAADDRTKARDLCDLGFLAESYGDSLSIEQILRADRFLAVAGSIYRCGGRSVDPELSDHANRIRTASTRATIAPSRIAGTPQCRVDKVGSRFSISATRSTGIPDRRPTVRRTGHRPWSAARGLCAALGGSASGTARGRPRQRLGPCPASG